MDLSAPKLPPKPIREQAKVLYAYDAQNEDELTIREGDIINVISKEIEDQGWFKGELNGKIGVFPDNFVELIRVPSSSDEPPEKPLPPRPGKGLTSSSTAAAASPSCTTTSSTPAAATSVTGIKSVAGKADANVNGIKDTVQQQQPQTTPKSSIFANLTKKSSSTSKVTSSTSPSSTLSSSLSKSSSMKPDVVPIEPSSAATVEIITSSENGSTGDHQPTSFTGIEVASSSKLSHITATRPKGPSNRRPPSYISVSSSRDQQQDPVNHHHHPANHLAENGNDSHAHPTTNGRVGASSAVTATTTVTASPGTTGTVTSPGSKGKEDPPWMIELRKTQEAKKQSGLPSLTERQSSIESSSSIDSAPAPVSRPSTLGKSCPSNRASGDFSNRIGQFNGSSSSSSSSPSAATVAAASGDSLSNPVSILKPMKPIKPGLSSAPPAAATVNNPPPPTSATTASTIKKEAQTAANNSSNSNHASQTGSSISSISNPIVKSIASTSCPVVLPAAAAASPVSANASVISQSAISVATISPPLILDSAAASMILELQREVRMIRECMIAKSDYDDLAKQVQELKDSIENQKQTQGKIVKELIDDLAEERKKLAMLTIDVDRLRKLSTTV